MRMRSRENEKRISTSEDREIEKERTKRQRE
jgi:hypothetical protein